MEQKAFSFTNSTGHVIRADVFELFEKIGEQYADIIFLDPPFNLGKKYSKSISDKRPEEEYRAWLELVVERAQDVLKPGGALFLYHLPIWALRIGALLEQSLTFRHWIAISMKNGFARGERLYPAHYALLYFTKGSPTVFTRPKLAPHLCRHCGEYTRDYGGYKSIIEEKGINLSDVWDDLSPVRHGSKKYRSANELPMEMYMRMMTISGKHGMNYVEPFAGSGAGAIAASQLGINFVVGDVLPENTRIICERLEESRAKLELVNE